MKRIWLPILAALCSLPLLAQPLTDGEVTGIDKAQARITLKHGEIKHLDMPPMKMIFRVRDAKLLDDVAVGDKVRFAADRVNGNFTVMAIEKAR
ncbi:MAG: copper-binding protein [Rubrivivax sp.]|nr:copper-binding protein [Rubrivivax sp.]